MSILEWFGAIAAYLVVWIGGGYLSTVIFMIWLDTTKWARTAELAFFGPVIWFGAAWLVAGAVVGIFLLGMAVS